MLSVAEGPPDANSLIVEFPGIVCCLILALIEIGTVPSEASLDAVAFSESFVEEDPFA
jgi:hypothetical protein